MRWLLSLPAIGSAIVAGQVAHAISRSDLPSLTNQDPSGIFGNPELPPLHLVALGDSTITAPGVEPLDACVVRRAALQLADRHQVSVTSVGEGGARARDALARQVPAALDARPDLVLLSLGANDVLHGSRIANFRADFEMIVSALTDHCPVVVAGVGDLATIPRIPPSLRWLVRRRSYRFDSAMIQVVDRYPRAIKAVTWDGTPSAFQDAPNLFAGDWFHANAEGHAVFAAAIREPLERVLDSI